MRDQEANMTARTPFCDSIRGKIVDKIQPTVQELSDKLGALKVKNEAQYGGVGVGAYPPTGTSYSSTNYGALSPPSSQATSPQSYHNQPTNTSHSGVPPSIGQQHHGSWICAPTALPSPPVSSYVPPMGIAQSTTAGQPITYGHSVLPAASHALSHQTEQVQHPAAINPHGVSSSEAPHVHAPSAYGTHVAPSMLADLSGLDDQSSTSPAPMYASNPMCKPAHFQAHPEYPQSLGQGDSGLTGYQSYDHNTSQLGVTAQSHLVSPLSTLSGSQQRPSLEPHQTEMTVNGVLYTAAYPNSRPSSAMGQHSSMTTDYLTPQIPAMPSRPHSSMGLAAGEPVRLDHTTDGGVLPGLPCSTSDHNHHEVYMQQVVAWRGQSESIGVLQTPQHFASQKVMPRPIPPPHTWVPELGRPLKTRWRAPDVHAIARGDMHANQELTKYLKRFSYLHGHGAQNEVYDALLRVQRTHGLPLTGRYDDATARAVELPVCDGSSTVGDSSMASNLRLSLTDTTKELPFGFLGGTWPHLNKPSITYQYRNFSPDLSQAEIRSAIGFAFAIWTVVVPYQFVEVPDTALADISISFVYGAHGDPPRIKEDGTDGNVFLGVGNVLAHAFSPGAPIALRGDIHFDEAENWAVPDTVAECLQNVALHEIGHALGLDHSTVKGNVMYRYMTGVKVPQPDDIEGMVAMYGPFRPGFQSLRSGIAGYDLADSRDIAFALDYDHSGKRDHIVLYRPGTGTLFIIRNSPFDHFTTVFSSSTGVARFDLRHNADRGFAFDFDHSGKMDHMVFYRPGYGAISIARNNNNGSFSPVYGPTTTIGGFDLRSPNDHLIAFDFDRSGRMDYLLGYRAGSGIVTIIKHTPANTFQSVFVSTTGIAGFDLRSPLDRLIAMDCDRSGNMDYIGAYRPGQGIFWPIEHSRTAPPSAPFRPMLPTPFAPGMTATSSLGGFDLRDPSDVVVALPGGRAVGYRPGKGAVATIDCALNIRKGVGRQFRGEFLSGGGMAGWDCRDRRDLLCSIDYIGRGRAGDLLWIRPGTGVCKIWANMFGAFAGQL